MSDRPSPPDPVFTLRPRSGTVQTVQYVDCNGKYSVLTGMSSGLVSLWDFQLKRKYWNQKLDGNVISSKFVDCNGDGSIIALQKEGKIIMWNIENSTIISEKFVENRGFCGISVVDNDGPRVVVADKDFGKVNIFNVVTGSIDTRICAKEPESRGMAMCVKVFEADGIKLILAGFEDGKVSCWDIRNPQEELSSIELFPEPVMSLDYNADTWHGVCGSALNTLETFTFTKRGLCQKYSVPIKNSGVSSVAIRLDGKIMASGGWDGRIRLFGCKKGKPLAVLNHHTDVVQCLDFAPSGIGNYSNILLSGSKDEQICLWKLY